MKASFKVTLKISGEGLSDGKVRSIVSEALADYPDYDVDVVDVKFALSGMHSEDAELKETMAEHAKQPYEVERRASEILEIQERLYRLEGRVDILEERAGLRRFVDDKPLYPPSAEQFCFPLGRPPKTPIESSRVQELEKFAQDLYFAASSLDWSSSDRERFAKRGAGLGLWEIPVRIHDRGP